MSIGERIRKLRVEKGLSQGDIEKASGLLRCYTSRVENGHTVPSLETLGKFAKALDIPLYQLFYEGNEPPPNGGRSAPGALQGWQLPCEGEAELRFLRRLARFLGRIPEPDREYLLTLARKLAETGS